MYLTPDPPQDAFFAEHFDNLENGLDGKTKWVRSQAKKDGADAAIAKYVLYWHKNVSHFDKRSKSK
jgi:hypothetical protein